MDSAKFEKYRTAGDIADLTLAKGIELCHDKLKASVICKTCDNMMLEKLNTGYKKLMKGIYLPTCLSINSIIGHNTYTEKDDYELKDNDIVRIELACHIDNNILINHNTAQTDSNVMYKGILDDSATAVFSVYKLESVGANSTEELLKHRLVVLESEILKLSSEKSPACFFRVLEALPSTLKSSKDKVRSGVRKTSSYCSNSVPNENPVLLLS